MNRGLRLGDGFFETVRAEGGIPLWWDAHTHRMDQSMRALGLEYPADYGHADLAARIGNLCKVCECMGAARVRLIFFREGGGAYGPETDAMAYVAEVSAAEPRHYAMPGEGISVDVFTALAKHRSPLATFKLLGNQLYIQAARWAQQRYLGDALVTNDAGFVIEGSASNLFVVKDGALHTPPLSDGCLGGVMRMVVLNEALHMGIPCFESQLTPEVLLQADEVFLTSAVKGIRWVRSFREKRYFHTTADKITEALRRRVATMLLEGAPPVQNPA